MSSTETAKIRIAASEHKFYSEINGDDSQSEVRRRQSVLFLGHLPGRNSFFPSFTVWDFINAPPENTGN